MIIYIASPYTLGNQEENVQAQMEAAHRIMDDGHTPVAPLLQHFLHLYRERPYEEWLANDLALIPRCDALLRLPGRSAGADREVDVAARSGIHVFYGWAAYAAAVLVVERTAS